MGRIRSVHPGQSKDDDFIELSFAAMAATLLLRCYADDNGVFEWKPKLLKREIFPAANVDMDEILAELVLHRQVKRFEVDGRQYGAIRNFLIWQRPQKPKSIHPLPASVADYVGSGRKKSRTHTGSGETNSGIGDYPGDDNSATDPSSASGNSATAPPSGDLQSRSGSGIRSQREEVGGKREEEIESSNELSQRARPRKPKPGLADLKAADFREYAAEKAPCAEVERELEKYRNWSLANGKSHKDAAAGFRNWLIKADEIARERGARPPANGHANGEPAGFTERVQRTLMERFGKLNDWNDDWGARPLKGRWADGCPISPAIQREFGYGGGEG